jgi:hypothetical protein
MGGSAPNGDAHEALVTGNVGDGGGNIHRVGIPIVRVGVNIHRVGVPIVRVGGNISRVDAPNFKQALRKNLCFRAG